MSKNMGFYSDKNGLAFATQDYCVCFTSIPPCIALEMSIRIAQYFSTEIALVPEWCSEACQTFKMLLFAKIANV